MYKGGYKIIDLNDHNFTPNGSTIHVPGIYEAIEGNYRHQLYIQNLHVSGIEFADRFVNFDLSGSQFIGSFRTLPNTATSVKIAFLIVNADDTVKVQEITIS